ncbi:MAG: ARPP-1 family domain-containing protein [Phycisphaerae bacterium]
MDTNQQPKTLSAFLAGLVTAEPTSHLNLTLVPLRGAGREEIEYTLSADAIQAGTLVITEVGEGGTVPELLAINEAELMVLLLEGEELVGAKQNRVLNTSVLLPAKSKTKIPVSCVEAGRWHRRSHGFSSGSYSSSGLRAMMTRSVSNSYRQLAEPRSDQGRVWAEVDRTMWASGSHSPTRAWFDMMKQKEEALTKYAECLACPAEARGVLVAIDGAFVAMDLFDKPSTLARIWSRLIRGYGVCPSNA